MSQQLALFPSPARSRSASKPLARRDDAQTSKNAAERVESFVAGHEATIYAAICAAGDRGATANEIAAGTTGTPHVLTGVQVNRRLKSMGERGLIERRARTDCSGFEARGSCAIWWRA